MDVRMKYNVTKRKYDGGLEAAKKFSVLFIWGEFCFGNQWLVKQLKRSKTDLSEAPWIRWIAEGRPVASFPSAIYELFNSDWENVEFSHLICSEPTFWTTLHYCHTTRVFLFQSRAQFHNLFHLINLSSKMAPRLGLAEVRHDCIYYNNC